MTAANPRPSELPAQLTLVAYPDPTVEALGFGPDHPYTEAVLASRLGPSTINLWRRYARLVIAATGQPITIDTADSLACIGLRGLAANSTGARTIARMIAFDTARRAGTLLAVRTALAPLPPYLVDRLPVGARRDHHLLTATPTTLKEQP